MATNEAKNDKQDEQDQRDEDLDFEVVVEGEDDPAGGKQKAAGEVDDDNQEDDERGERRARSGGERRDEEDGADDDKNLTPEQREKRKKRREERQLRKQRREEERAEMEEMRRELAELRSQVGGTQQTIRQGEYQRVSASLNEAVRQMREAQSLMQEARTAENWGAHADALEAYTEAKSRAERLNVIKVRYDQAAEQERTGAGETRTDPEIARRAREWRSKNSWYDPERRDADSKIAAAIDEQLADEGYSPRSQAYWKELDKRIAKQLPHRAGRDRADELDEDIDDTPSPTSGSGRERAPNSGKRVVRLSKERIAALREAGVDVKNPKEMAPYLKQYAKWDRENQDLLRQGR